MGDAIAAVLDLLLGWVPERQPWRAIVSAIYLVGALVGVAVLVALVVKAVG